MNAMVEASEATDKVQLGIIGQPTMTEGMNVFVHVACHG